MKSRKPVFKRDIKELIQIVNDTYKEFNGHLNFERGNYPLTNDYHNIYKEYTVRYILDKIQDRFEKSRPK